MSKKKKDPLAPPVLTGIDARKARLRQGEVFEFGDKGNSMVPKIKSEDKCTYIAVLNKDEAPKEARCYTRDELHGNIKSPAFITPDQLRKGDMVYCHVGRWHFTHLISAVKENVYQISNNHGHVNGNISAAKVFALVIKVEDREVRYK